MALTMPRFPAPAGSLAAAAQAPTDPSRRALIGGAGVAALLVAGAAMAGVAPASPSAFDKAEARYKAASDRFAALPDDMEVTSPAAYEREADSYVDAVRQMRTAPIGNWSEFGRAFAIATENGESCDLIPAVVAHLYEASQRLAKQEG